MMSHPCQSPSSCQSRASCGSQSSLLSESPPPKGKACTSNRRWRPNVWLLIMVKVELRISVKFTLKLKINLVLFLSTDSWSKGVGEERSLNISKDYFKMIIIWYSNSFQCTHSTFMLHVFEKVSEIAICCPSGQLPFVIATSHHWCPKHVLQLEFVLVTVGCLPCESGTEEFLPRHWWNSNKSSSQLAPRFPECLCVCACFNRCRSSSS